jgi:transcriptional regulator with XRE-family HTH domain
MGSMFPIGERLSEERQRLGMNQTDFAALASVTRKTLFGYETGARAPDAEALASWSVVGLDVLYVVTGRRSPAGASAPGVAEPEPPLSDRDRLRVAVEAVEEGLAETRRKLPPDKRAELFLAAYDLIAEMAEPEQSRANVIRLVRVAA